MKEAAGEANMTVITIVLIGIVLVAGTAIITAMMRNTSTQANQQSTTTATTKEQCTAAGGIWSNKRCTYPTN